MAERASLDVGVLGWERDGLLLGSVDVDIISRELLKRLCAPSWKIGIHYFDWMVVVKVTHVYLSPL